MDELNEVVLRLQANPEEIVPVADPTEDNSLLYDNLLSQYMMVSSSTYSSTKGANNSDDDNKNLLDLTPGESCLSSKMEACPTNPINYDLNEDDQTTIRKPHIILQLNPLKPKIYLQLKLSDQSISSQEKHC